jgi:hypothetical protein
MIQVYWKKYKTLWLTILAVFIASRLILLVLSEIAIEKIPSTPPAWKAERALEHPILSRGAVWDSQWYMMIAENGYKDSEHFDPKHYSSIGFFPLFAFLIFLANFIFHDSLVSGLILSNIFFLISAFLIYLVVKETEDEATAERATWYLFLFPSAYIFSSVYPESLLLMLWLGTVLSAHKQKWWLLGILGFLAAMTKPFGFFIFIPAILLYFHKKGSLKKIRLDVLWIFLIPLGLLTVSFIHYRVSGDPFAYSHIQQGAWGHVFSDPITAIFKSIAEYSFDWAFNGWILLIFLIILSAGYKKLPKSYWLFALCALLFIATNSPIIGVWRYVASFFPLVILLAIWGKSQKVHQALVISMALLQGALFIFWSLSYWFVS